MQFNFDYKTENFLKIVLKNALNQKIRVFFAGGVVRDNLLGIKTKDIDLIILGNAIEFCSRIPELEIKSIHKDFYTVKVLYQGLEFDVASTRTEKYPFSGCLPVVDSVGVDLFDDVKRRDFTINSLYCELKLVNDRITYSLIDLVDGVSDLNNKILRVLHSNSYIDDPTRILRGVGFKYRLNVDFSCADNFLINDYLNHVDRLNMSISRVESVFKKIFISSSYIDVFCEVIEKEYYRILFDDELKFDINKINSIISDLSLNNIQISEFLFMVLQNTCIQKLNDLSIIEKMKIFSKYKKEYLAYYLYKTFDNDVLDYLKISKINFFITGDNLIELGYKKGKLFSEIFNKLLIEKFNNPSKYNNINDEREFILKTFPLD